LANGFDDLHDCFYIDLTGKVDPLIMDDTLVITIP
jgi:hypothetical protein